MLRSTARLPDVQVEEVRAQALLDGESPTLGKQVVEVRASGAPLACLAGAVGCHGGLRCSRSARRSCSCWRGLYLGARRAHTTRLRRHLAPRRRSRRLYPTGSETSEASLVTLPGRPLLSVERVWSRYGRLTLTVMVCVAVCPSVSVAVTVSVAVPRVSAMIVKVSPIPASASVPSTIEATSGWLDSAVKIMTPSRSLKDLPSSGRIVRLRISSPGASGSAGSSTVSVVNSPGATVG